MLLLVGPEGSGKSHLGALWAEKAGAVVVQAARLNETEIGTIAASPAVLIEDADRVGEAEAQLFHTVNAVIQSRSWTLITARAGPGAWNLHTPDLLSRLRLAPLVRLGAPDLELAQAVLFKLFSDRQLLVEPRVAAFIALRMERSLAAARDIVAALDREALAQGRRVTRAMVAELLREGPEEDEAT